MQVTKPTKRPSLLETERARLAETRLRWAEQDAREGNLSLTRESDQVPEASSIRGMDMAPPASSQSPSLSSAPVTNHSGSHGTQPGSVAKCLPFGQESSAGSTVGHGTIAPAVASVPNGGTLCALSQSISVISESPSKSIGTNASCENAVPEYLQETIDIHALDSSKFCWKMVDCVNRQ